MHKIIRCLILAATMAIVPLTHASSFSVDQSALWGDDAESGWGIQFVQQDDTIFATMFHYGSDNKPTWFIATLSPGAGVFSGVVYKTTGPYFGGAWDPTKLSLGDVGSMTWKPTYIGQGILNYTINGAPVVRTITRTTFKRNKIDGLFGGGLKTATLSGDCSAFPIGVTLASLEITTNAPVTLGSFTLNTGSQTCSIIDKTVSQYGQFSNASGAYTCTGGDHGTMDFIEIEANVGSLTGRVAMQSAVSTCRLQGFFAGIRG